ncbi:hypothetical protein EmuJ_000087200 [Echinococcus multilocularis]|uniref:Uncharacterized protein n=1 Tax=Echinococcus multilocularis TaxID=6211 RepID=A0A087VY62_ECHMU|nr:hypothetical protein EmuJ_000087200 [Echinococcus multilocularis]
MLGQLTRRHHRPRDTPHEACAADRFLHASTGKNSNTISRDMIGVQRLMLFIAILRVFVLPTIHFTRSASLLLQFILAVFALFVLHYLSLLLSTHVERPKHRERKEFMEMKDIRVQCKPVGPSDVFGQAEAAKSSCLLLRTQIPVQCHFLRPESLPSPPPACFSHLDILRSQIHLSPFSSSSSCVILRQCHFAHPRPHLFTLSSQFTPESEDSLYASSIAETEFGEIGVAVSSHTRPETHSFQPSIWEGDQPLLHSASVPSGIQPFCAGATLSVPNPAPRSPSYLLMYLSHPSRNGGTPPFLISVIHPLHNRQNEG